MDFTTKLNQLTRRVNQALDELVPPHTGPHTGPARIHEAMRYSLQAGGKRLRPVLVLAATELFAKPPAPASAPSPIPALSSQLLALRSSAAAAVAIECIHTYSLIHDDLPCMDNDDLRRGRPTAHKQFDEATALLAGDALLTHAFVLLATHYASDPRLATALVCELADAAGSTRLIGGQMQDLLAEKKADATTSDLEYIHLNKTAAMIETSLVFGGLIGGASESHLALLRTAGRHLGLTFQIIDDVLDATADSVTLGKTAGKDAQADKTTYVKLHGIEAARRMAQEQTDLALAALRALPGDTGFLIGLTEAMTVRAK